MVSSKKKYRDAWELPDGPWVDKKIYILPNIIAFQIDNDLQLKFVSGKKVDIWTKEVNATNLESKPKKFLPKKAYFWGTLSQAVEAKMHERIYKIFIFLQNISSLKKSAISILYELR